MSYIKNEGHFINYIHKTARDNNVDLDEMYSDEYYLSNFYITNKFNQFTWEIKHNPTLLKIGKVEQLIEELKTTKKKTINPIIINQKNNLEYQQQRIEDIKTNPKLQPRKYLSINESAKFIDSIITLDFPGVYAFGIDDTFLYIGSSKNLISRIPGSFTDRIIALKEEKTYDVYYIQCDSEIDARILELYYIGLCKPTLNVYGVTKEKMSVEILNPKKFNKLVSAKLEWTFGDSSL